MAEEAPAPAWQYASGDFTFGRVAPAHIPRGWERAPQPSHLARHKGRKVWKRPETRLGENTEKLENPQNEERNPLRDVSANTPRPVKRLRVRDGMARSEKNEGGGFKNYLTTLRDGVADTPKRKLTCGNDPAAEGPLPQAETGEKDLEEGANNEVEEDSVQASESPAQAGVRDFLTANDLADVKASAKAPIPVDVGSKTANDAPLKALPNATSNGFSQHDTAEILFAQIEQGRREGEKGTEAVDKNAGSALSIDIKEASNRDGIINVNANEISETVAISSADKDSLKTMPAIAVVAQTPKATLRNTRASPKSQPNIDNTQQLDSPQIGTTLLRRESLRTKGSPRKRSSAQKSKTPHRRHGLKKRDTLQEREILQQFNAFASPNHATAAENAMSVERDASPSKISPDQSLIAQHDAQPAEVLIESTENERIQEAALETRPDVIVAETVLESKDLQRAVEAIEVCQTSNEEGAVAALDLTSLSSEANGNMDQANDSIANFEIEQAEQTIAEVCDKVDLPTRKTRSGARISDDTSMLKDFLNRAQAKKAAKNNPSLSAEFPKLQASPARRSPRKALEPHSGDAPSPQKSKKAAKAPSTPPRKQVIESSDSSDDQEIANEPTSFRRSSRTRLPAPSKTPPGAPSFIPVRRGDGSDQVVLQKSQAQEMAIVTRANTRRNKGQSKPPALALQELPIESPVKMTAKQRADHAKQVAWAEKLASYQESKDAPDEPDDQRPKVRRMRGLGAVNGTPAKKATAAVAPPTGTPAPKRRSKTK